MQVEALVGDPNFNYLGTFDSLGEIFVEAARRALSVGRENAGRASPNRELPGFAFVLSDPRARLIDVEARRTNVPFLMAEFLWHITCRTDAAMLAAYAPGIARFSADGRSFTGSAYGPRLFGPHRATSQWASVLRCLRADPQSRRAVLLLMYAAEDRSPANRDMTCTVALQFFVREGRLDFVTQMRSNDIMRGLPSDVFLFTLLQEVAAAELGLTPGTYTHIANVAQIYAPDLAWAQECVGRRVRSKGVMSALPSHQVWQALETIAAIEDSLRTRCARVVPPLAEHSSFQAWQRMFGRFHATRRGGNADSIDWIAEYRRATCEPPAA